MRLTNLIFFLFGQLLLVIIAIILLGSLLGGFYLPALIVISVYLILMLIYVFSLKESLQNGFKIKWLGTRGFLSEVNSSIEALSKSRWRYRKRFAQLIKEVNALASAIPDAGIIIDEFNNIEWCNRSSLTLLGVDQDRDIGQKVGNIIRFPAFNQYLKNHKTDNYIDIEDTNNKRFLRFRIVEYQDYSSRNKKFISVRDVTTQSKLNQIRKDFIANASHELKTPLTTIKGYSEIINEDSKEQELANFANQITLQADRMNKIIEDLLSLSKIENSEIDLNDESIDVGSIINQVLESYESMSKKINFKVNIECDKKLMSDESLFYSIVENLVSNAHRYTDEGGEVFISWSANPEYATLLVQDTGIGIPQESIDRITERFYRVDKGRNAKTGGTGLGLSIVKHALDRMGAELIIESELLVGSSFSCRFPNKRLAKD